MYQDKLQSDQIRATSALLKFCREHQRSGEWIQLIENCLHSLERGNNKEAVSYFDKVPFGGMGCFNDWFPSKVFPNETDEYAWTVFEALAAYWYSRMKLLSK